MENKKIIFTRFPYSSQLGGEELHTLDLALHWQKQGHDVAYLGNCAILIELFQKHNLEVIEVDPKIPVPVTKSNLLRFILRWPYFYKRAAAIARLLKEHNPDRVFMLGYLDKIILWKHLKLAKIPYIFMEHARLGSWFWFTPCLLSYYLGAKNGIVVTVSEQMRKKFRFIPNVKVVGNGVNTKFFTETKKLNDDIEALISGYGKEPTRPLFVKVARLSDDKGIPTFLNFLKLLEISGVKDFRALIVGTGDKEDSFIKTIVALGLSKQVKIVGHIIDRSQIAGLLQRAMCSFLLSNKLDPFGLVAAESLAAKTPVIVSSLTGIADYLPKSLVVNPNAPNAVLKSFHNLPEIDFAKLTKDFSAKKMYAKYDQLWDSSL